MTHIAAVAAPPLFRVLGMRRSGNHAVIDWLRRNIEGPVVFLNDCTPGDPYARFELVETPNGEAHGPTFRSTPWFAELTARRGARAHIVSYEDQAPEVVRTLGWDDRRWQSVVVRRSFLNWLASYYRLTTTRQSGTGWGVDFAHRLTSRFVTWRALAEHAMSSGVTDIAFDDWAASARYRAAALTRAGLKVRDNGLGAEASYGGGSSFDGIGSLDRRWSELADEREFLSLARHAAGDGRLMGTLDALYPEDARRLRRLRATGRLD